MTNVLRSRNARVSLDGDFIHNQIINISFNSTHTLVSTDGVTEQIMTWIETKRTNAFSIRFFYTPALEATLRALEQNAEIPLILWPNGYDLTGKPALHASVIITDYTQGISNGDVQYLDCNFQNAGELMEVTNIVNHNPDGTDPIFGTTQRQTRQDFTDGERIDFSTDLGIGTATTRGSLFFRIDTVRNAGNSSTITLEFQPVTSSDGVNYTPASNAVGTITSTAADPVPNIPRLFQWHNLTLRNAVGMEVSVTSFSGIPAQTLGFDYNWLIQAADGSHGAIGP